MEPGQPLTFKVSEGEEKNIQIIRQQLLSELDTYAVNERENLISETEHFLMPKIIAEQLERIKRDAITNLAFSDAHYKEKCFYIDTNGNLAITTDINLFHSFIYAYGMLGEIDKGIRTARNIVKVSIINRMVKMTLQELDFKTEWATSTTNNLYPFVNIESKKFFDFCVKTWINKKEKPITWISFLFRKMWVGETETKNFKYQIKDITIREFAEYWNNRVTHKYSYKIAFDGKTAKIKTLPDITNNKLEQAFDNLIAEFEK